LCSGEKSSVALHQQKIEALKRKLVESQLELRAEIKKVEATDGQVEISFNARCIDIEGDAKHWINGILFLDTQSVISVFLQMADDVNRSSDVVK
jgi:hypothetical protein